MMSTQSFAALILMLLAFPSSYASKEPEENALGKALEHVSRGDGILMGSIASVVMLALVSISMVFSLILSSGFKHRNTRIWLLFAVAFAVGNLVSTVGTQNLVYDYPKASNQYAAGLAFSGGVAASSILHVYLHDLIRLLRPLVTRNSNADRDVIRGTENLFDEKVWNAFADASQSCASSRLHDAELGHIEASQQRSILVGQAADEDQGASAGRGHGVSTFGRHVSNFLQDKLKEVIGTTMNLVAAPTSESASCRAQVRDLDRCDNHSLDFHEGNGTVADVRTSLAGANVSLSESSDSDREDIDEYDASHSNSNYQLESDGLNDFLDGSTKRQLAAESDRTKNILENQLKTFQRKAARCMPKSFSVHCGTRRERYQYHAGESSMSAHCSSRFQMYEINPLYVSSAGEASSLPYNSVHHGTAESHGESPSNAISTHSKSARSGHLTESGRHTSGILPVPEHFLNPYEIGVDGETIESDMSSIYHADNEGSEASIPIVVRDNIAVDDIVGGNIFGSGLVQSFVQGLVIGSSFTRGFLPGVQICASIFLHSVPTLIGLLASLIRAGYAPSVALRRQIISGLPVIAGGISGSSIASVFDAVFIYVGAFSSGQLMFLALPALFSSLRIQHQPHPLKNYLVMLFLAGLALPIALGFLPPLHRP